MTISHKTTTEGGIVLTKPSTQNHKLRAYERTAILPPRRLTAFVIIKHRPLMLKTFYDIFHNRYLSVYCKDTCYYKTIFSKVFLFPNLATYYI